MNICINSKEVLMVVFPIGTFYLIKHIFDDDTQQLFLKIKVDKELFIIINYIDNVCE